MGCSVTPTPYGFAMNVTSLTRPTTFPDLQAGRVIYEVDTFRYWVYSGSAWVFLANATAGSRPGVSLSDSAQSIPTGVGTAITWGTEVLDVDNWTSGGSANVTVPTGWAGRWLVTFVASWASSSLGTTPQAFVQLNGTSTWAADGLTPNGLHTVTFLTQLAVADVLNCQVFQNSGGAVNCTSSLNIAWISV